MTQPLTFEERKEKHPIAPGLKAEVMQIMEISSEQADDLISEIQNNCYNSYLSWWADKKNLNSECK